MCQEHLLAVRRHLEGWGQLKQQQTELACLLRELYRRHETGHQSFTVAKSIEVCDTLGCFEAESEILRNGSKPARHHGFSRQLAKGKVHFHRVESCSVILKETLG